MQALSLQGRLNLFLAEGEWDVSHAEKGFKVKKSATVGRKNVSRQAEMSRELC